MLQPLHQPAMGVENIDKTKTSAAHWIVPGSILLGIGHINIRTDCLYVERSKTFANKIIIEGVFIKFHLLEVRIEYVNAPAAEVGRQDKPLAIDLRDGRALVNSSVFCIGYLGIIYLDHSRSRLYARIPSLHRAIFRYPHKDSALAGGKQEIRGAAVEHDSRWRSWRRLAGSIWNRNDKWNNRSGAVI